MGFWPFGRKSRRSSRIEEKTVAAGEENMRRRPTTDTRQPQGGGQAGSTAGKGPSSNESKRQKRDPDRNITNASQSQSRYASASAPSRAQTAPHTKPNDNEQVGNEKAGLPSQPASRSLASRATHDDREAALPYYFQNPTSHSSLGPDNFTAVPRPPTLRAKRSSAEQGFNRRKSSKRKAEDQAREQEIRALSSPTTTRPSTRTSEPLRRDTKKIPGGLNKHFDRPNSNISLPLAESLHESTSEASDHHTFTVNALSVLTPRPTLRYSDKSRQGPLRTMNQSRASTQKEKRPMIPEEDMKSKRRIDDLADTLDASGLRELMERDQRRRERKRQQDQEKLQRKLERRAARQREEDWKRVGQDVKPEGLEQETTENGRGVSDREAMGLGIGDAAVKHEEAKPEDPFADQRARTPGSWLEDPSREHLPEERAEDPFRDDVSETLALQGTKPDMTENVEHQSGPPVHEQEDLLPPPPIIDRESRISQGSIASQTSQSHAGRGFSSTSQLSGIGRETTPDIPENVESDRRNSDNSGRRITSWTSFFKRGGTRQKRGSADRGRTTPSDFSNTSRESFSRQAPPPLIPPRSFRRSGSTPVRTMSKFREDLPELPTSPLESTIQSPEVPAAVASSSPHPDEPGSGFVEKTMADSPTSPTSEQHRESAHRSLETNTSEVGPRSAVVSQSLASVDSEGSWLSGKPVKRSSHQSVQPLHESTSSLPPNVEELSDPREEEDVTADAYFTQLATGHENRRESGSAVHRKPSSSAMGAASDIGDEDDEDAFPEAHTDDEDEAIHKSVEHFPTIVHAEPSAKSKEGLLQDFQSSESEATSPELEGETPESGAGPSETQWIHRATSVDYGKGHARHISAGSAKLLDLPRRTSIDSKRLSSASGERVTASQGESAVVKEEKP
jgi:hypothetical protein